MSDNVPFDRAVEAALHWLHDTPQPHEAALQHHGLHVARTVLPSTGREVALSACPSGAGQRPVLIVTAAESHRGGDVWSFTDDGWASAVGAVAARTPVHTTWNGPPATSGSVGLVHGAHPTLLAAVARYFAGCPDHRRGCAAHGCRWLIDRSALVVHPSVTVGDHAAAESGGGGW